MMSTNFYNQVCQNNINLVSIGCQFHDNLLVRIPSRRRSMSDTHPRTHQVEPKSLTLYIKHHKKTTQ